MAASYASQKLNATAGALKAGQQPESIQGLINSQGQYAPNGSYYGPKGINSLNTSAYGAANRSPQTAANGSYYGPKGTNALNTDARYAAARSVGFNPDPVQRVTGDAERMGRMMMAESASIKNQYGNVSTPGLMGVGEVIRNRVLSDRFPNTVDSVMNQRKQFSPMGDGSFARTPANDTATRIAESILSGESPPTVGTSLNYGNLDTINNKPGYSSSKSKAAFNAMDVEAQVADYRNPKSFAHSFGTIGSPSDVSFNGFGTPSATTSFAATPKSPLQSAMDSWNPPQSSAIPAPTSTGMLPNTAAAARMAGLQQAPSQNMQQPTAPPAGLPGFTPQSGFTPQGLPSNFRGTAGVASTGRVPGWGYSPSADYSAPSAGTSLASSTPESYSPQAGPGDQVAGDAPEVVSDNPMQGSQNPMQEGENPQVKRDRQQKYASRGATIGGIVAGPLGTVVGGTLGWQMGKTPPRQQQAIASNPQALTANVKSINDMVEERGGKGNPQMQVTEAGFKDVLTNPAKVTKEPEKYTTLEQMLAALAQGVDPETGKPIT
jgi:spore germination cell wall hydrolase CwlJ-like protein